MDFCSRLVGVDVYGIEGFYIPWLYTMPDQIGANLAGLAYLRRREGSWTRGMAAYARNAMMLTSAAVVLLAPLLVIVARASGFIPDTQVLTAIETIGANLCWLPPVVGW